jgi:hypothetical protein
MLLLAGAFAELFSNYKSIYASLVQLFRPVIRRVFPNKNIKFNEDDVIEEPCPPSEMVPAWMWGGGIGMS